MKVDKNQLVTPVECATTDMDTGLPIYRSVGGIPIRLEIAARLLAGWMDDSSYGTIHLIDEYCGWAMTWADRLIKAHNESCEAGE